MGFLISLKSYAKFDHERFEVFMAVTIHSLEASDRQGPHGITSLRSVFPILEVS
jgi:hypothetical protein